MRFDGGIPTPPKRPRHGDVGAATRRLFVPTSFQPAAQPLGTAGTSFSKSKPSHPPTSQVCRQSDPPAAFATSTRRPAVPPPAPPAPPPPPKVRLEKGMIVTFDGGKRFGYIDTVFDGLDEFWLCDQGTKQTVFQDGPGNSSTNDIRSFRAAELKFTGEWSPTASAEAVVEVPLEVAEDVLSAEDFSSQWEKRVNVPVQVERLVAGAPARIFLGPGFTPDVKAAEKLVSEHVHGLRLTRQITEHIDVPMELLPALRAEASFESHWQERTGMPVRLVFPAPGGGHGKIALGPGFRSDVVQALGLIGERLQALADVHCPDDDLGLQGNLTESNLMEEQHEISSEDLQAQLEKLKAEQESVEAALAQQASAKDRTAGLAQNSGTGSNVARPPQAFLTPYPQTLANVAENARSIAGAGSAPSAMAATEKNAIVSRVKKIGTQTTAEAAKAKLVALQAGGLDSCASHQETWPLHRGTPSWQREEEAARQDAENKSMSQKAVDETPVTSGAAAENSSPAAMRQDSTNNVASGNPGFLTEATVPAPETSSVSGGTAQASPAKGTIGYWVANQSQFADLPSLPDTWIRVKSKDESQIYYVCLTDGTTTMKMPTGSAKEREETLPSQKESSSEPTAGLPPGWTERVSRSTGQKYYWNASLGKSQFEVPES